MVHAKHLCQMLKVKQGNASSQRQSINHVSSHMNVLKALTFNATVQDLMLNHLTLATIDPETQREQELISASRANTPTTAELITFLESRYRALELIHTTLSLKTGATTPRSSHSTRNKVIKPSYQKVATQLQCSLCNGSHRLFKCDNFLKLKAKQRFNYAKQSELSFSCLQPFTEDHTCSKSVLSVSQETSYILTYGQTNSINKWPNDSKQSICRCTSQLNCRR